MNGDDCARRTCWVRVGAFLDAPPYSGTGFGHVALLEAAPALDVFEPLWCKVRRCSAQLWFAPRGLQRTRFWFGAMYVRSW